MKAIAHKDLISATELDFTAMELRVLTRHSSGVRLSYGLYYQNDVQPLAEILSKEIADIVDGYPLNERKEIVRGDETIHYFNAARGKMTVHDVVQAVFARREMPVAPKPFVPVPMAMRGETALSMPALPVAIEAISERVSPWAIMLSAEKPEALLVADNDTEFKPAKAGQKTKLAVKINLMLALAAMGTQFLPSTQTKTQETAAASAIDVDAPEKTKAQPIPVSPEQAQVFALMKEYDTLYRTNALPDIKLLQGCVAGPTTTQWREKMSKVQYQAQQKNVVVLDLGHGEDTLSPQAFSPYTTGTIYAKITDANVAMVLTPVIVNAMGSHIPEARVQQSITKIVQDMKASRAAELAQYNEKNNTNLRDDGFYEIGAFSDAILDKLGVKEVTKKKMTDGDKLHNTDMRKMRAGVGRALRKTMLDKKLAMTETGVVDAVARAVQAQAAQNNMLVAYTRTPLQDGLSLHGMSYRTAIAYRAGLSYFLSQKGYNVIPVSIHADSNPNPYYTHSKVYSYAKERDGAAASKTAGTLAQNLAGTFMQASYSKSSEVASGTANYAMPRCSVNGVLLETYQMGSTTGRVRAYNVMHNQNDAATKVANSILAGIQKTLLASTTKKNAIALAAR